MAVLPFLLADLLARIRHGRNRSAFSYQQVFKEAVGISSFPLVYFFAFLYYTDVASTVAVLLCYRQALNRRYVSSALVSLKDVASVHESNGSLTSWPTVRQAGVVSLTLRQTNILWVAFVALASLSEVLRHQGARGNNQSRRKEAGDLASLTPCECSL